MPSKPVNKGPDEGSYQNEYANYLQPHRNDMHPDMAGSRGGDVMAYIMASIPDPHEGRIARRASEGEQNMGKP